MYAGDIIRRLRLLKGVKQSRMAQLLGMTQQAYSKIERRKAVERRRFSQIVSVLACSEEELHIVRINSWAERPLE